MTLKKFLRLKKGTSPGQPAQPGKPYAKLTELFFRENDECLQKTHNCDINRQHCINTVYI